MRLIDADKLKDKYASWYNLINDKSICAVQTKEIDWMPTISLDEGVKIIWSAQIDDIIEKMKRLRGRKDNSVQYERGISDCIKILEEAKE